MHPFESQAGQPAFISVSVINRRTGVTFYFRCYCASTAEAVAYTRDTFNDPKLWAIDQEAIVAPAISRAPVPFQPNLF